jgi:hypothetical protein
MEENNMRVTTHAMPPGTRRWFRFSYHLQGRSTRDSLPHQLRDGDAALLLHDTLCKRGFAYAGPIINYPVLGRPLAEAVPVDDSFLQPDDLLVITTRPPLDDANDGVKCRVHRSYTTLEEKVLACVRRHLTRCSRSNVIVSDIHARAFPEVARYKNILFRQKRGASIDKCLPYGTNSWIRPPATAACTAAYMIYEKHAWADGPGLLAVFGMCGLDTLVWNHRLATQFSTLIATVPFAMTELIAPLTPVSQPFTLCFANQWQVRLLTIP